MAKLMTHIHLKDPIVQACSPDVMSPDHMYRLLQNIYVTAQKKLDATITEACIRYCKESGCTDLYMIDGEELERRLRVSCNWDALRTELETSHMNCMEQGLPEQAKAYRYVIDLMHRWEPGRPDDRPD